MQVYLARAVFIPFQTAFAVKNCLDLSRDDIILPEMMEVLEEIIMETVKLLLESECNHVYHTII